MKFQMSPNIAVRTTSMKEAVEFYSKLLGFPNRSQDPDLADLDANPIRLFIIEHKEIQGPVMELYVVDLEQAREELVSQGCEVLRWHGKGQDCYIQDPFGVIFNIWELDDLKK